MADVTVDAGLAAWLKSPALYVVQTDATLATKWGDRAGTSEYISPFAIKADAIAEATRQIAFLGGPLFKDEHTVAGLQSKLVGQCVTLVGDRYAYAAGAAVFVLRAQESETTDTTTLTVLRRP